LNSWAELVIVLEKQKGFRFKALKVGMGCACNKIGPGMLRNALTMILD